MRIQLMLLPMLMVAAPATAQTAVPPVTQPAIQVPPQLADPATAQRLGNAMQALSKAFLNLPVGEVQAALEGRQPTRAERKLTVRDLGRRDDPNFDRKFQEQIAATTPMIQQSM
jgi:hypothetical protein